MKKKPKTDKYGRPLTSSCRICKKDYPLDYSAEDKYGDEFRPRLDYCGECSRQRNNHYYPFI